ncbi:hypothetical protein BU15DRAFT_63852 [Melanogaster broomeanus]|nr:hypothetical protein BU15DRAFT_63852 [Melanogaster broomeanus]
MYNYVSPRDDIPGMPVDIRQSYGQTETCNDVDNIYSILQLHCSLDDFGGAEWNVNMAGCDGRYFLLHFVTDQVLGRPTTWLYPGHLALRSSVLESLLSIPHEEHQKGAEGTCDENPIILHGVIQHEFDHLLTFLFGAYAGEQHQEEFLVSVLKLSAFFDISHGFQYAVTELSHLSPFNPSLKLQLGRQCRFCADCKEATVVRLRQSNTLRYEDAVIDAAILEVMDLQFFKLKQRDWWTELRDAAQF